MYVRMYTHANVKKGGKKEKNITVCMCVCVCSKLLNTTSKKWLVGWLVRLLRTYVRGAFVYPFGLQLSA